MKLLVFSICKDEAATIGEVLDNIPTHISGISEIQKVVIDDGSTDDTVEVARKHGAKVYSDGIQKRLAVRFREMVDIALSRGVDVLVNIDGDMQFNPGDIPTLVKPIVENTADFVAADRFTDGNGNRKRPKNMPTGKYYGNRLGAWIVGKLSGQKFNDVTCGFRAYSHKALTVLNTNGEYTYTQESFQVMAMKKMRIVAMPVKVTYFKGRKSRVVSSIFSYVGSSAISILRSYRDFAPLRFFGWLGFVPFLIGVASTLGFLAHWAATGSFSPFKFLGFVGIYFLTLAIIVWALGLVADMLSRMLNNQEKILEHTKQIRWPDKEKRS